MSVPSGVALLAMLEGEAQRTREPNKAPIIVSERKYLHGIAIYDHDCAFDCGRKIENHQDDVGGFFVQTPRGYCAICYSCWKAGGYTTGER